jgi:two-component system, chemotaxis family, CheB/CheR fusion protein
MLTEPQERRPHQRVVVIVGAASADALDWALRGISVSSASLIIPRNGVSMPLDAIHRAARAATSEVQGVAALEPGRVYVVPEHREVEIADGQLRLSPAHEGNGTTDRLLRGVAPLGRDLLVVVMPGGASTAELGLKRIKETGGFTIQLVVGDPTAPGDTPDAGLCDVVATLPDLADRITTFERARSDATIIEDDQRPADVVQDGLRDVLSIVRVRTGHDFSNYKRATLYRRIARRMQVYQTDSIAEYHLRLREDPGELTFLLRDFLISVTNFFRDADAFDALREQVIPKIFAHHHGDGPIRVWVAGCATGEEAYSLGMLLAEHVAHAGGPPPQIFATDIDEPSLAEARLGRYPESIAADVSPERLHRFFDHDSNGYRVRKELRELVLFSPHNVLRDPPFSRLDLVSCRNLLIYLNRDAQDRVLNMFHFGLRNDGFLFLGMSETAETTAGQFAAVDPKHRVFTRRMTVSSLGVDTVVGSGRWPHHAPISPSPSAERALIAGDVHHRLVEHYAPPSVLVNEELDVVHVSERAGRFLGLAGGEPTRQLLRLVLPQLRLDVRSALYAARQPGNGSEVRRARFDDNGHSRVVEITVRNADLPELGRRMMLVLFDERTSEAPEGTGAAAAAAKPPLTELEPVVREIEDDLHRTREQLRNTIEQYETSLEELKASNEELHAINEELRSATEELETSKEEQQSVNEELVTLNHELKSKVDELSRANSDLQNLMTSTDIGVVFLDRGLNIKRFTPRAQELINVIATDVGRPLAHLTHQLDFDGLPDAARDVLASLRPFEREVASRNGHRYFARLLPYRSLEDRIEGVVLTFVDISELRVAQAALSVSEARFRQTLRSAPLIALSQDRELRNTWGFILGREIDARGPSDADLFGPEEAARMLEVKRAILADGTSRRVEVAVAVDGEPRIFDFRIEAIEQDGAITGVRSVGFDITPSKVAENALREADARKDQFLATVSHELRSPLTPLVAALDIQRLAAGNPERVEKARGIMERQVNHIIRLVDDLLDVSRISQDKISLVREPIDIGTVLQQAIEAVRPRFEQAQQTLTVDVPPEGIQVMGDLTRLDQVMMNLLTNASKYTPAGGTIAVRAAADPSAGTMTITVRDDGIGIAPELLPHIFDLFVQAREVAGRNDGGLGIGLNLVRRLVELHGGTVTAHSEGTGKGTEVRVTLPLLDELS